MSSPVQSASSQTAARPRADSPRSRTVIPPSVLATMAGMAVREVAGVHAVGGGTSGLSRVREALPGGSSASSGVEVEAGEHQAAFDLQIVVDYGVPVVALAQDVRERLIEVVEDLSGFEVVEVNVAVVDVHLDDDEEADA